MATAFPPALDTFVDPVGTDLLDNANALLKHDFQHTHINDAVAAIEAQLWLTGLLTGSGVPGAGLGSNTNMYLDTVTGIIYRKTAGTWAAIYTPTTGGAAPYQYDPGTGSGGTNAGSSNYKGVLFTPSSNMSLTEITCEYSGFVASATYQAFVVTLAANVPGATTIATVVGSTTLLTMNASTTGVTMGKVTMAFASPLALTSGTTYCFLPGTPSQAGGTVGLQIYNAAFNGNITLADPPGVLGDWVAVAVSTPIVTSVASVVAATVSRPSVGFTAKL